MSSLEKDMELIALVEEYKLIYDKKDFMYKNKVAVQNAWRAIGQKIQIPANECRHRWDIIRNRYTKERKIMSCGTVGNRKEWPCMAILHFLDDVVARRKSFGSMSNQPTKTVDEITDMVEEIFYCEEIDGVPGVSQKKRRLDSSQLSTSTSMTSREGTPISEPCSPRISQENNLEEKLKISVANISDLVSNENIKKPEVDSDMMFCLSLCESLKGIKDKKKKSKAKILILQTLDAFIED